MVRSRGFTLIELVIVIVLLGILSAVALPKFFDVSVDARRSTNNAAVGALNAGLAAAVGRATITTAIINGTGAAALTNGSSTVNPYLVNLDNNSSLPLNNYVGIYSITNPIPVGGGRGANSTTPDLTATASGGAFPYADILTAANGGPYLGCITLFNVLMSDNSVSAGATSSANYQNITTTSTPISTGLTTSSKTFTSINGSTAFSAVNTSIATMAITGNAISAAAVPGTSGVCVYLLSSSSSASVKFYIIYDAALGTFYPAESN